MHQFESTVVPGILQTEQYASAILQEFHGGNMPAETVRKLVELRTRRRDLLVDADAPRKRPQFYKGLFDVSVYLDRSYAPMDVRAKHLVDQEEAAMALARAAASDRTGALTSDQIDQAVHRVSERDGLDFTDRH